MQCSYYAHAVLTLSPSSCCAHAVVLLCSYWAHAVLMLCSCCVHAVLMLASGVSQVSQGNRLCTAPVLGSTQSKAAVLDKPGKLAMEAVYEVQHNMLSWHHSSAQLQ